MRENIIKGITEFLNSASKRDFVLKYIGLFDVKYKLQEETIQQVINLDRKNMVLPNVLAKVVIVNSLYSTFLNTINPDEMETHENNGRKKTLSVSQVAHHIVELAKTKKLDEMIITGNKDAVKLICEVSGDDWKSVYSFATKYCNWHNHDAFAIVDRYTRGFLYYTNRNLEVPLYHKSDMKKEMLNYEEFCSILTEFQQRFDLKEFSVKEIDKFIWMFGKKYFISYD